MWQLLDDISEAGFSRALIGVLTGIRLGFTWSNSPGYEHMEPIVFPVIKGEDGITHHLRIAYHGRQSRSQKRLRRHGSPSLLQNHDGLCSVVLIVNETPELQVL